MRSTLTLCLALGALGALAGCEHDDELEYIPDGATPDAAPGCVDGTTRACTTAGGCAGEATCQGGELGDCVPPAERCNGDDDDCDGTTDEGFATGEACTVGIGACAVEATTACNVAGDGVECAATPGVPAAETCTGRDNDCDGTLDEGFALGDPCTVGVGACAADGVNTCNAAGDAVECAATAGDPAAESCNGVDDDCDGAADEAIEAVPCETGELGVCAVGATTCVDGATLCPAVTAPSDETCDGLDNDCDGDVDDVDGVGEPCTVGVGACQAAAVSTCDVALGEVVCPAVEQPAEPGEYCQNGEDDDCDGDTDEAGCYFPCDGDGDCPAGNLCEGGQCTPGDCRDDADCRPDGLCMERAARGLPAGPVARFCEPGDCRADGDCPAEQYCEGFFCLDRPAACLDAEVIRDFGEYAGDTRGALAELGASCAVVQGGPEEAWRLELDRAGTICIDTFGSSFNTTLSVRRDCVRAESEIACNDNVTLRYSASQIELEYDPAADYTLVVGSAGQVVDDRGPYALRVRTGSCAACRNDADCVPDDRCAPVQRVCVPDTCGDGIRDAGEGCDDGGFVDGDGCSARCQIEAGFDCIQPPAGVAPVPVRIDGLRQCGPEAAVGAPVALPPWDAYRAFRVGGGVQFAEDGRHTYRFIIAVNGVDVVFGPNAQFQSLAALDAALRDFRSEAFAIDADDVVTVRVGDPSCADNSGVLDISIRPVDFCSSI